VRGKVSRIDHNLGSRDEQVVVLIEAYERLRKSHGLATTELRTMASAGMPPEVFAMEIPATLEKLGVKGTWRRSADRRRR